VARKDESVVFVVEFEDGTRDHIYIDRYTLRSGDHVAKTIARERQQKGELPNKPIKSVARRDYAAPPGPGGAGGDPAR
jgi:hypothetical protein